MHSMASPSTWMLAFTVLLGCSTNAFLLNPFARVPKLSESLSFRNHEPQLSSSQLHSTSGSGEESWMDRLAREWSAMNKDSDSKPSVPAPTPAPKAVVLPSPAAGINKPQPTPPQTLPRPTFRSDQETRFMPERYRTVLAWAQQEPECPSTMMLHQLRNTKVSEFGKYSRWGQAENRRAQFWTDLMKEESKQQQQQQQQQQPQQQQQQQQKVKPAPVSVPASDTNANLLNHKVITKPATPIKAQDNIKPPVEKRSVSLAKDAKTRQITAKRWTKGNTTDNTAFVADQFKGRHIRQQVPQNQVVRRRTTMLKNDTHQVSIPQKAYNARPQQPIAPRKVTSEDAGALLSGSNTIPLHPKERRLTSEDAGTMRKSHVQPAKAQPNPVVPRKVTREDAGAVNPKAITPKQPNVSDQDQTLYLRRTKQVAAAAVAGKSRWGDCESERPSNAGAVGSAPSFSSVQRRSPQDMQASLGNHVRATATTVSSGGGTTVPPPHSSNGVNVSPMEPKGPAKVVDNKDPMTKEESESAAKLFESRNQQVAAHAAAGNSRWGDMESSKVQEIVEKPSAQTKPSAPSGPTLDQLAKEWGSMNADHDALTPTPKSVAPPPAPKPETPPAAHTPDLFDGRNAQVVAHDIAGNNRWGEMESRKTLNIIQDGDASVVGQSIPPPPKSSSSSSSMSDLMKEWAASKPSSPPPPAQTQKETPKPSSSSTSMDQLAKEWGARNTDADSAATTVKIPYTPPPSPPAPQVQKSIQSPPKASSAPSVTMDDLAKAWGSMNADHDKPLIKKQSPPPPTEVVAEKKETKSSTFIGKPPTNLDGTSTPDSPQITDLAAAWAALNRDQDSVKLPNIKKPVESSAPSPPPSEPTKSTPPTFSLDQLAQEWASRNKAQD